MKVKNKPWVQWGIDAKKSKERALKQICTNCKCTFEENGLSAYPGLCKKCVDNNGQV